MLPMLYETRFLDIPGVPENQGFACLSLKVWRGPLMGLSAKCWNTAQPLGDMRPTPSTETISQLLTYHPAY